jgi:hypothetical protein
VNHVGYQPGSRKFVIYTGKADRFTVNRLQDDEFSPVFEGTFETAGTEIMDARRGDFSALTEEGIYRIDAGEENSRCFIVNRDVYDTVERMMSYFFTWQRCNDDLGWHGNCHTGDSIVLKNGKKKFLGKGHHQSGDLRKWAWGTSLAMSGYAEYALKRKPHWDKGILAEELRHGCEYFLSLIHDEGFLIDCSFVPESFPIERTGLGCGDYRMMWQNRIYFESPAAWVAHWHTIRLLAVASRYFKQTDPSYSGICLEGAKKIWNYMGSHPMTKYSIPRLPPHGHNYMNQFHGGFYEGSALHHGGKALAAAYLFEAENREEYHTAAQESLKALAALRIGGDVRKNPAAACFYESPEVKDLANRYNYFYCTTIPPAFTAALKVWPSDTDSDAWKNNVQAIAEQFSIICERNPFQRVPGTWYIKKEDPSVIDNRIPEEDTAGGEMPGKGEQIFAHYFNHQVNLDIIVYGRFLNDAGKLLNKKAYSDLAQNQIDWIMGANKYDTSNIEGVGYNHPYRGIFGEFFPPVPQIPGGIYVELQDRGFDMKKEVFANEYDSPMVGYFMALLAEIKE